jgi:hypothetical protein
MNKELIVPTGFEELGVVAADLAELTKPRPGGQIARKPKVVPQSLIDLAVKNNPLESLPRWQFSGEAAAQSTFRQALPKLKEGFFKMHFMLLDELGITFETKDEEVLRLVKAKVSTSQSMKTYIDALVTSYSTFKRIFAFVETIAHYGRFEEKHLTSVYSICEAYATLNDVVRSSRMMKLIDTQVAYNQERYIFELPTVLPISNLAEIILAMPVTFVGGLNSSVTDRYPSVSTPTQLVCDLVGTRSFAWLYQMYNLRNRSLKDFPSLDPMPSDYAEFRKVAGGLCDLELIATPYHHLVTEEWRDTRWVPLIDPVALALYRDIPFVTIMKRWSGNGIFPLLCDLIGNTVDHLKLNLGTLKAFPRTWWVYGDTGISRPGDALAAGSLPPFAKEVIKEFEQGTVFNFLTR